VTETAEHVIIRFRWDDDEGDDWIEGDGLLDPLLAARGELAAGDTRLLYLGWLRTVQLGGLDDDEDEDLADRLEKQRLFQRLFTWVPTPDDAYARASEIQQRLTETGHHRSAGPVDLLISVTAERHRLTVLTEAAVTGQPVRLVTGTS
jgi:predicted nucleic acid-binding protein